MVFDSSKGLGDVARHKQSDHRNDRWNRFAESALDSMDPFFITCPNQNDCINIQPFWFISNWKFPALLTHRGRISVVGPDIPGAKGLYLARPLNHIDL